MWPQALRSNWHTADISSSVPTRLEDKVHHWVKLWSNLGPLLCWILADEYVCNSLSATSWKTDLTPATKKIKTKTTSKHLLKTVGLFSGALWHHFIEEGFSVCKKGHRRDHFIPLWELSGTKMFPLISYSQLFYSKILVNAQLKTFLITSLEAVKP